MLKSRQVQAPVNHEGRKKVYEKPSLVVYGSLTRLTRKTGSIPDKGGTKVHRM
jgi:hypothetical protein